MGLDVLSRCWHYEIEREALFVQSPSRVDLQDYGLQYTSEAQLTNMNQNGQITYLMRLRLIVMET